MACTDISLSLSLALYSVVISVVVVAVDDDDATLQTTKTNIFIYFEANRLLITCLRNRLCEKSFFSTSLLALVLSLCRSGMHGYMVRMRGRSAEIFKMIYTLKAFHSLYRTRSQRKNGKGLTHIRRNRIEAKRKLYERKRLTK